MKLSSLFLAVALFSACSASTTRKISEAPPSPEAVFTNPAFSQASEHTRDVAREIFGYRKISEHEYRKSDPQSWQANSGTHVRRDTHAKTHACVKASFEVNPNLAPELQVGLFAKPGATYSSWIRFENGLGVIQHDLLGDARAMSIKVMGVRGPKLFDSFGDDEAFTQDFLMNNAPMFFVDGADDSRDFFAAEASGNIGSYFKDALLNPLQRERKKTVFTAALLGAKVEPNLLRATYWSSTPYSFGGQPVQYIARPCADHANVAYRGLPGLRPDEQAFVSKMNAFFNKYSPLVGNNPDFQDFPNGFRWLGFLKDAGAQLGLNDQYASKLSSDTRDYLRDNIVADLAEGREGCFEFGIERFKDERSTPVNKATVTWKTNTDWLARVRIPAQTGVASDEQVGFCENMSFNTWHSLEEHKPIGELNDLRGMIYRAMSMYRHDANGKKSGEPLADFRMQLATQQQALEFYR